MAELVYLWEMGRMKGLFVSVVFLTFGVFIALRGLAFVVSFVLCEKEEAR
jgi:hypothetical protein